MAFRPEAPYTELKRVEEFIDQAQTVEDLRQIAAIEGSVIGYKALGRLIAGRMTAEEMKPDEARLAKSQPAHAAAAREPANQVHELLSLADFFPPDRQLYDYQVDGVDFLVKNRGALLGDEMGLGKSIQAIGALKILHRLSHIKRVLILCPRPLIGQWEQELRKWAPELFVQKVRGSRQKRIQSWSSGATVLIASYESWRNDLAQLSKSSRRFDLVILDEVQRIKHADAAVTRAVRRINAAYRWGLSGTPLENRLEDVTTIFDSLHPDLFSKPEYRSSIQVVKARIKPYFLRRRLADVQLELPPLSRKDEWLYLTTKQRQSYDQVAGQSRQRLSKPEAKRIHVFSEINRLKQICSYDERTQSSTKLDYLARQLETIVSNDQKALVFSQFPNKILDPLSRHLQDYETAIFHGGLSDRRANQMLHDFERKKSPQVLLTSVKSGGTGLNLTRANHVFHLDHWWNPAVAKQADARAHRIGQKLPVFVHSLFANDTVEQKIHKLLSEKQQLFNVVIDDLTEEEIRGNLSLEELFGLFDLDPPLTKGTRRKSYRSGYRPTASYADLKQTETLLNKATTVEEVRKTADIQISKIGYKAFCFLLGELSTPEVMKNI